jgi:hypothetical protein
MYGHDDEWVESRVKWKLTKLKLSCSEMLVFGEGTEAIEADLRRIAESRRAGLPIMAFWRSEDLWTLLGSEKIVWTRKGHVEDLLLDDLNWATEHGMIEAMQRDSIAGFDASAARHKLDWEALRLTAKSGNEYVVWAAPGGGCVALWNVLLMVIGMQKARDTGLATHDAANGGL